MKFAIINLTLLTLILPLKIFADDNTEISIRVLAQMGIGDKGDTICYRGVMRKLLKVKTTPLAHCAIDLGDGNVAEWSVRTGDQGGERSAHLRIQPKREFIESAPECETIFVREYKEPTNHPNDIVLFARYYVAHPNDLNDYSVLFNNCQHFCALCSYGRSESWQANPIANIFRGLRRAFAVL
jgi:hypothetical protein